MAAPYRADHVGSLLRPPELVQARTDFGQKKITAEQLREVEEKSILKAIELQREVGIDVFTEGEYRRSGWSGAIRESVEGLVPDAEAPTRRILGAWQGPHAGMANAGMANAGMANAGMANAGMANAGMANAGMANAGMANAGTATAIPPMVVGGKLRQT